MIMKKTSNRMLKIVIIPIIFVVNKRRQKRRKIRSKIIVMRSQGNNESIKEALGVKAYLELQIWSN